MATKTWNVTRDARTGDTYGAGKCDHLPIGSYGGEAYQSWLGFVNPDTSGIPSSSAITSAVLYVKTSDHYHVAPNAGTCAVRRCDAFTEGTDSHPMGSNGGGITGASEPTVYSGNGVSFTFTTAANTWRSRDITGIVKDSWGVSGHSVYLRLSTTDGVTEFWSREYSSGSDAYIVVTYETVGPPTVEWGMQWSQRRSITPTFDALLYDSQNDTVTGYALQVNTQSDFLGTMMWDITDQTTGLDGAMPGGTISRVYAGTTLTRGNTYYARIKAKDAVSGYGPWSEVLDFLVNRLPTCTPNTSEDGHIAHCVYSAGSGWTTPRLYLAWAYWDDEGQQSTELTLSVTDDAGTPVTGSPFTLAAGTTDYTVGVDLTEGNYYKWQVKAKDDLEYGSYCALQRTRARWGMAKYRSGALGAVLSWSIGVQTQSVYANTGIVWEYGASTTDTSDPPTSGWKSTFGAVPKYSPQTYLQWRAWLFAWGGAGPLTSPAISQFKVNYTANAIIADHWTKSDSAKCQIDEAAFAFGKQSAQVIAQASTSYYWYQDVQVEVGRTYTLSGRMQTSGAPYARIAVMNTAMDTVFATTATLTSTLGWERYYAPSFVATTETVRVMLQSQSNAGASGDVHFDGIMLEASGVASAWSPGLIGRASVLDSGGVMVDASAGGVFRLRGSAGDALDEVTLGEHGLVLAGHTNTGFTVAGGGSATYSNKTLHWVRLDKWVFFRLSFSVTAAGSGSTQITVTGTGLPDIAAGTTVGGDRGGVSPTRLIARPISASSECQIGEMRNLSDFSLILGSQLANGASYSFVGMYEST